MKIFIGIMAAIFALGAIAEKDREDKKTMATCFCASMVALVLISIM